MVLRALTGGLLAAALLTPPVASAQAPTKELQATASVQARVQLTRITSDRVSGTVRFTGRLRDGTPLRGKGTIVIPGTRTAAGFRTSGRGSVIFDATLRRADAEGRRTAVPLTDAVGILRFAGGSTEGTGIFMDKGTLRFLGGSTEGTGI